ncbi:MULTISPECIES: VOC family protein [Actinoalloteichus]|uniref:Lactoylglutathione lyase n=1 Tax=Actinoalloteichus fjordicus TaxID=1612552 RepID=A0AAC9PSK3_9PSEU|nr:MULTISPECIES: VOC family protein [Actinoalloteichus]APU15097.1 putative lactoylglutathione lyase [Actinoalloteichus fjordicus]APU21165.1 putative lactoylglutathione lyase [Actinoalloteichus sp. GBA129-24]
MALSLDIITLGVPQQAAAHAFYAAAFSVTAAADEQPAHLDLHGTGRLALQQIDALAADVDADPATTGFRGYVLSCAVDQPAEVEALLGTATVQGATVVRQAKKQLFGEFTAVHRAPDGAVWKLAAATKKNTAPVPDPPKPTETAVFLGVASPKASLVFYTALGMSVDRDYGDTFIDFTISDGVCRLGLLTRKALAKDAGVAEVGDGFSALVLTHLAGSREEVDALLAAAESAGGRVAAAVAHPDRGAYAGYFTDPDGYHWRVTTAA